MLRKHSFMKAVIPVMPKKSKPRCKEKCEACFKEQSWTVMKDRETKAFTMVQQRAIRPFSKGI